MKKISLVFVVMAMMLVGCARPQNKNETGKLSVVATSTMVTDLVKEIGKDKVNVMGMMVEGVDPHLYKAKPSDVRAVQYADVVTFNGVHLEAKLDDVLTGLQKIDRNIIKIEDALDPEDLIIDEEQGGVDPHIWFNVDLWRKGALHVAEKLGEFDPENAAYYQANADAYVIELDELSEYIENRIQEIPEKQRVLVTAHDAFTYFGDRYGMQVEAIQGISTQSEAGIKDIDKVANLIVEREIKAIYTESSVPQKTIESLQAAVREKGFNVEIGGELYSDSLKSNTSYIETYKLNIDTIVENLK